MARTALILCIVAGCLSAKDRAWQTAQLLDKTVNPYFHVTPATTGPTNAPIIYNGSAVAVNARSSDGKVDYENYVIKTDDKVYLVELAHLKTFKAPHLSLVKPLSVVAEKDNLRIRDLDGTEYEASILKKTDIDGDGRVIVAAAQPAPAQAKPEGKVEAKVEAKPEPKVEAPKPAKPESAFVMAALPRGDVAPKPKVEDKPKPVAATPPPAAPKPEPKVEAVVTTKAPPEVKPTPVAKPAPEVKTVQAAPKVEAAVVKAPPKAELAPEKPTPVKSEGATARPGLKDRAWQGGHLSSVANNNYFFNVTYTTDLDGAEWAFSQGSDGRYTVTSKIAVTTPSPYTYDDYVIESPFVAYLVQRMRPKTSPPPRFPGTDALKFAVEKNKMYVLDEEGREFETKVIKLVQKNAIVDPLARAAR